MSRSAKAEDGKIIALYFERDESAIAETVKKYEAFIFSVCNGILDQKQDSEECLKPT